MIEKFKERRVMNHNDNKAVLRFLKRQSYAVITTMKIVRPLKVKTSCSHHHKEKTVMRASPNSDSVVESLSLGGLEFISGDARCHISVTNSWRRLHSIVQ